MRLVADTIRCTFIVCLLTGCVYLPRSERGLQSVALPPQAGDRIAMALSAQGKPDSHAYLLEDPAESLTSRVGLLRAADRTVDAQYYTWKRDVAGHLMIREMVTAAERGVRVRVLVDDIHMNGLVNRIKVIDKHPNIEIRIFNPFSVRMPFDPGLFRILEFAIDGNRLNHRMHNKALIADNQLAIIGGRNIGNDYYGLAKKLNFLDTDVLLSGDIVPALSHGFDAYWNSRWAYPVNAFLTQIEPDMAEINRIIDKSVSSYSELLPAEDDYNWRALVDRLKQSAEFGDYAVLFDSPDIRWFRQADEMADGLIESALQVEREILIATPYLIPTRRLLDTAQLLKERGVTFKVVTNSLASNDLAMAHAGYARFRDRLLDTGAELYELRADAAVGVKGQKVPSMRQSFHSKYMVFDDDLVYIGSLNLDPRSVDINTELGVVLQSRRLADDVRASFEILIHPDNAWRVTRRDDGFVWTSSAGVTGRQPATGFWQRAMSFLFSLLPLSEQL